MNKGLEIKDKIYTIREFQIMLDSDLAELYGVGTKQLNKAVKRNIERFPARFMFQLTASEYDSLRSQIATSRLRDNLRFQNDTSKIEDSLRFQNGTLNKSRELLDKLNSVY